MIVDTYDVVLLDLDGTLYRGSEVIAGAPEAVQCLRDLKKSVGFITNNSSRTPDAIAGHLTSLGIVAAPEEVTTSALVTADLLAERGAKDAFVVGESGLRTALAAAGITVAREDTDRVDAVVVGLDRSVDYARLCAASVLVERGATLVATNGDASFPAADGSVWPGAGAILAAIQTTTGALAEVVGKPHPPLLRGALARAGGGRPLVVGDRLDTDIAGAARLGWDAALVLTGISSSADATTSSWRPTYVIDTVARIVDAEGESAL
jgi:glycerol 3-phosphatase-2